MTIGSLFSGIGGLEMGLEACGMGPVVWQCDSDPYARAVLAEHWPDVRRYNDVKEIDGNATRVDLVCGGFPCQDISDAGTKAGISGARSGLWAEFARIIRELRPVAVFVENVAPLLGRGINRVLWDLASLGFDAEWDVFRASDVGAPHRRERVFILAYSNAELGKARMVLHGKHEAPVFRGREDARPGLWATPTPEACRGDDGLPGRMDVAVLGNSVVPQQAAYAFQALVARVGVAFMNRPVDSTDYHVRFPCEIWKRTGRRCPSCLLRFSRVRVKAAKR